MEYNLRKFNDMKNQIVNKAFEVVFFEQVVKESILSTSTLPTVSGVKRRSIHVI